MTTAYERLRATLPNTPRRWLVTGAAGFIGSHLTETLLTLGQHVVGLDNFATGSRRNLEAAAGDHPRFRFIEGDIRDAAACAEACAGVDVVLHQAALGSVPRSVADPLTSHQVNVDGFVNVLLAARDAGVRRFVYASSSSVYGDHPALPKREPEIGTPLSPYAVTKRVNELYARTFQDHYGLEAIGLRYFNVFGPRQDPDGPYAAVIPRWLGQMLARRACTINGDGETSRDFCYVANAVQANLLAAAAPPEATGRVYNVAVGDRTTLNALHAHLGRALVGLGVLSEAPAPVYAPFREGDIRHSLADVSAAREALGYAPSHRIGEGLAETVAWYAAQHATVVPLS